jgi:hypothetical protein
MKRHLLLAALALASSTAQAQTKWPQDFGSRAALSQWLRAHPPGPREIGAPLYPGAVFDVECSTDYSWARRHFNIIGWCFTINAEMNTLKGFITGPGRPYGPSAIVTGQGLLYQTEPKQQAFFAAFPQGEPDAAELRVRRHPDMRYDRACSAWRSYMLGVQARTDRWQRAWCFVADAGLLELRKFFRFGELDDARSGALVSFYQVMDAPPRSELEYLIPVP